MPVTRDQDFGSKKIKDHPIHIGGSGNFIIWNIERFLVWFSPQVIQSLIAFFSRIIDIDYPQLRFSEWTEVQCGT